MADEEPLRGVYRPGDRCWQSVEAGFDQGVPTMFNGAVLLQAVQSGKQAGHPTYVVRMTSPATPSEWTSPAPSKTSLADPKLEALRALSAAVSKPNRGSVGELAAIAHEAGLSHGELRILLPSHDWQSLLASTRPDLSR